jgi:hypothetical protein
VFQPSPQHDLRQLVDELLEAHMDTIELVVATRADEDWTSHVHYLQGLIRLAHTELAERPI